MWEFDAHATADPDAEPMTVPGLRARAEVLNERFSGLGEPPASDPDGTPERFAVELVMRGAPHQVTTGFFATKDEAAERAAPFVDDALALETLRAWLTRLDGHEPELPPNIDDVYTVLVSEHRGRGTDNFRSGPSANGFADMGRVRSVWAAYAPDDAEKQAAQAGR